MEQVQTKVCTNCGEEKKLTDFYKQKNGKFGYYSSCKICVCKKRKNYLDSYEQDSKIIKKCRECEVEKPETEFPKFSNRCKACTNNYTREFSKKYIDRLQNEERFCSTCGVSSLDVKFKADGNICLPCVQATQKLYRASSAKFSTYYEKLKLFEPSVRENNNGDLEVECTNSNCKKYFTPTNTEVGIRLRSVLGLIGSGGAEGRFYCSQECKDTCVLYRLKPIHAIKADLLAAGHIRQLSREVPREFKKIAFEHRGKKCEKCGTTKKLHVHHIEGVIEQPMFACDVKNVRIYCQDCHIKVHQIPGCSYYDYRCDTSAEELMGFFNTPKDQPSPQISVPLNSTSITHQKGATNHA